MSYILDALKKADAERERGAVPGLHTQQLVPGPAFKDLNWILHPCVWLITFGLTVLCGLAWLALNSGFNTWALPLTETINSTAARVAPDPVISKAAIVLAPQAPAASSAPDEISDTPLLKNPPNAKIPKQVVTQQSSGTVALAAVSRLPMVEELSADFRLNLPKLIISGATYADNPAYRMLIINGQVFHEGEQPAPDLKLEQIKAKAAVLNYKGTRYLQAY